MSTLLLAVESNGSSIPYLVGCILLIGLLSLIATINGLLAKRVFGAAQGWLSSAVSVAVTAATLATGFAAGRATAALASRAQSHRAETDALQASGQLDGAGVAQRQAQARQLEQAMLRQQ